ncbi:stalk domain-containing protein [Desulfotomaculum sp. 1211_IL3151]|uniref:stalk domain-containing protein n=1 Tax=Desulfotomaculum sp. 1211_IL3151 TaxID=3084055 RepID=UPI002FDB3DB2
MPRRLLVVLVFFIFMSGSAYAEASVALDGRLLKDCQLIIVEKQVMLPLRPIFEEAGYKLESNLPEGIIIGRKGQNFVQINLRQPGGVLNQTDLNLNTAPRLIAGRAYLSVQDICHILNLENREEPGLKFISLSHRPEMTKEGVIGHLLSADRQMLRVEYYNNPEFLAQHQIAPSPKIQSKEDLIKHLSNYWDQTFIDSIWQEASQDGQYIGFFTEGSIPLLYNKELNVTYLSPAEAKIHALMPIWGEDSLTEFEEIVYTLHKNEGGKLIITDIQFP